MTTFPTPSPQIPAPEPRGEVSPNLLFWPLHLFFRPGRFFRHYGHEPIPVLTAIFAWLYGMSGVIDRISWKTATNPALFDTLYRTWPSYLAIVIGGGIFAGALYYAIGGWWYHARLAWCGADDAEKPTARRVYLYASMVMAAPMLLLTAFEVLYYDTPRQANDDASFAWLYLLLAVFPFWSIWTSYRGVRTVFETNRLPTLIWYVALPGTVYAVAMVLVIGAIAMATAAAPPDLHNPAVFRSKTIQFQYPGNWWPDDQDPDFHPEYDVGVLAPQDAVIRFICFDTEQTADAELQSAVADFDAFAEDWQITGRFATWGQYSGSGVNAVAVFDGTPCRVRLFVGEIFPGSGLAFQMRQIAADNVAGDVLPGFAQIEQTFRLTAPSAH